MRLMYMVSELHETVSTCTLTRSTISVGKRSSKARLPFTEAFNARVYSGK